MKNPTEAVAMFDWIAEFVICIATLDSKRGVRIEVTAEDMDDGEQKLIIVSRTGKTSGEALAKCVRHGMTQFRLTESHAEAQRRGGGKP